MATFPTTGDDIITGTSGPDTIDALAGDDIVNGEAGDDILFGSEDDDTLNGGDDDDTLDGGVDSDMINGDAGNDILKVAGPGTENANGGSGDDRLVVDYSSSTANVGTRTLQFAIDPPTPNAGGGYDGIYTNRTGHVVTFTSIESFDITAGTGNDFIWTGDGDDIVKTGSGDDYLITFGGSDTLNGGTGADFMRGGLGNDIYFVDDSGDIVDELDGEGSDTVRTGLGTKAVPYVLPAFVENLVGTSPANQGVEGNSLDNMIVMGVGNDLVVLDDGGVDTVSGGVGNDFIYYGAALTAADVTNGGAGTDTIGLLGSTNVIFGAASLVDVERLALYTDGGTASYNITMNDANVASGAEFFVTAASLSASETLTFNGAAETNGRFTVHGGAGNDLIVGGAGGDFVIGNAGSDTLFGVGGLDFLIGGLGADQLRGGAGGDRFVYQSTAQSTTASVDHILDFQHVDRIDLSAIDANGNAGDGDTAFTFVGSAAFTNTAGQLRAYQSGPDWFVEGDVNGDGVADLIIQVTLPDATPLGAGDFIL